MDTHRKGGEGEKEKDRHGRNAREKQGGKVTDPHRYIHTYTEEACI